MILSRKYEIEVSNGYGGWTHLNLATYDDRAAAELVATRETTEYPEGTFYGREWRIVTVTRSIDD